MRNERQKTADTVEELHFWQLRKNLSLSDVFHFFRYEGEITNHLILDSKLHVGSHKRIEPHF